ncbi:probable receptor-like protein kinase At5g61350 [Rutidosis leptorrhynchoides]|uniref:probable receptor-like protein kinase At5g61350 n=1 Tax=Rutidosis leptorrhynchoides TaxID=125765 RepID=UPI003A9967B6
MRSLVYKAELEHFDNTDFDSVEGKNKCDLPKRHVAIKHIKKTSDEQGEHGFIAEIEILSRCKHPNIVSLVGFCDEGRDMIIVYDLASNGSLDDYLGATSKMTTFTWVQRINLCLGIAHGLKYIHTSLDHKQNIIHRDLKSANILLNVSII